ncbi:MAG: trypsin-like peptidase domain-containing protein, partial [Paracoccaceae bacterium]|nr:trypsin-like peptidase domain-containing protein [Paracoccaceae bacterium]
DDNAGISIDLPMGMVAFSRYTPPFAHYDPANGSGVTVLLISTPGDQTTLSGLYSLLQTLSIVPTDGPRSLTGTGFDITGTSADRTTFAHAEVAGRTVKGYLVSWGKGNEALMSHVLTAMKDSFRSTGPQALDASMVPLSASQKSGMVAGLSLRKPVMARSGFFVDAAGDVLTTTEVLKNCGRVTVGERHTATVVLKDDTLGLALLRPKEPLSPLAYAATAPAAPGVQAQIAVAGYPYQGVLPGAALTFGTFDAGQGLNGEANLRRLSLKAEPGDVGGPVLDDSGALVGMLLPAKTDGTVLPDGVRFALGAGPIATALAGKGITLASAQPNATPMAPEDLATLGRKMTVLVACWK